MPDKRPATVSQTARALPGFHGVFLMITAGLMGCSRPQPSPGDLSGCYELTWSQDGVRQTGPLLPGTILLDTVRVASATGGDAAYYRIDAVTAGDTAAQQVSPFPVLNWQEVFGRRGWSPAGVDSIDLYFGDGAGLEWKIGLARSEGPWRGRGTYHSSDSDSTVVEISASEVACGGRSQVR